MKWRNSSGCSFLQVIAKSNTKDLARKIPLDVAYGLVRRAVNPQRQSDVSKMSDVDRAVRFIFEKVRMIIDNIVCIHHAMELCEMCKMAPFIDRVISEYSSAFHGGDLPGDLPVRSASHPEVRPTQYFQGTLTGKIHGLNECVITSFFLLLLVISL